MNPMNFDNARPIEYDDIYTALAKERQRDLIADAAERRLVRRAKQAQPSRGRGWRFWRQPLAG